MRLPSKPQSKRLRSGFQAPPEQNVENGKELVQRVSITAKAVGAPMAGINNVGAVGGLTGAPGKSPIGATYCGWSNWADKTGKTMAVAADRDVDLAFWTIDTNKAPDTAAVRVNCNAAVDDFKTLSAALSRNHAAVTLAAKRTCAVSEPLVIDQVTNLNVTIEQGAELQAQRGSQLFGVLLTVQSSSDVVIQGQPAASGASAPPEDPYNISAAELARPMLRMCTVTLSWVFALSVR